MDLTHAARTRANVLITGETGVGKEGVARWIHLQGPRRPRPFVRVNGNGLSNALVRRADRGTVFLDKVGELTVGKQATLLRFIDNQCMASDVPGGPVDVRLIAATDQDLYARIGAGTFREDLFYRLNVIHIMIPPLRERSRDDVLALLWTRLRQASDANRVRCPELTPDAERRLATYSWPGNVRELRNVAERLALRPLNRPMTPDDLPAEVCSRHR